MNGDDYVRVCPVCGAEHAPSATQCGDCGTLLIGVDLTPRAVAPEAIATATADDVPVAAPTVADVAPAHCPHADCGATNPPGSRECLYCGRPISITTTPAAAAEATPRHGLYHLPTALAANFAIERVLPAAGAEAELMLLKGRKTGVRVMAKLYRPGIAPKGEVLERVGGVAYAHVVRILSHGVSDDVAFEVMEYCTGGSLRDMMAAGALAPTRVENILGEVSEALAALHECRVVHRDLKPENVLVRRAEPLDLVLTDFGIASLQDATQLFTGTARTARYAAPEAMTGVLDEAADYWSLGMMVMEMLLGAHPFEGLSEPVIAHRLATGGIDTSDIRDPVWRKLCRGLLQRDPGRRWGIAEIRRWRAGDASLADPGEGGRQLRHPYRIGNEECRSTTELAIAFARQWPAAAKDLRRGDFGVWVREELKDHNLQRFLHDLNERGGSDDWKLFLLIRHLAPDMPPVWRAQAIDEETLLANAARAAEQDKDAAGWLESLFAEHVLESLAADAQPALARLSPIWNQGWGDFLRAWQVAERGLEQWRQSRVDSGEVVVDYDSLLYGNEGGLRRPPAGLVHGPLLLALERPDYARRLRDTTLAEAHAHFTHSPWLEPLTKAAVTDDAIGIATLVAVFHLLSQARRASEDGHRRLAQRKERRQAETSQLAVRANQILGEIRSFASDLPLFGNHSYRQRLAERIEDFLTLSRDARGLLPTQGDEAGPALRTIARAEPLLLGMRDRLDEWESTQRINALWRSERLVNVTVGGFIALLIFAPQWLPAMIAVPGAFMAWRTWITLHHRSAVRRLAAGLPLRLSHAAP